MCFLGVVKGQSPAEVEGSVLIENVKLEKKGDILLLEFDIKVKEEALNYRQDWRIVPEISLKSKTQIISFPCVLINGRQKERHFHRKERFENSWLKENYPAFKTYITKKGIEEVIHYSSSIPYKDWMNEATFIIHQYLGSPKAKLQLFSSDNYGCIDWIQDKTYEVKVNYIMPEKEEKKQTIQHSAFLDFPQGKSIIYPHYKRNSLELEEIRDNIQKILDDENREINHIYLHGYASPEGSYTLNEKLSRAHAESLRDYLIQYFKLNEEIFIVSNTVEDWSGFCTLIEKREMADKERIFTIVTSEDSPDGKERKLRALGSTWYTLMKNIFPLLRRTEYRIEYTIRDFSESEILNRNDINLELLSHFEYYKLAMSYDERDNKRLEILEKAVLTYPDDVIALSNYAAALLAKGEVDRAGQYLEKIKDSPLAYNNMGVYLLLKGKEENALPYFQKAKSMGIPQAEDNLKEVERKK
ncbi:MAG: DUF3868 domain-containing protein [Odoribacter sp.]|nr:DUF3868 domain-containing protein [Odoribacter sp.]